MMLPFSKQFEVFVWEGSKTHSVRDFRKDWPKDYQPKPKELAHCYRESRGKKVFRDGIQVAGMQLIGRFPFKPCEPIEIWLDEVNAMLMIAISERELMLDEKLLFAWKDGFRVPGSTESNPGYKPLFAMRDFWIEKHDLKYNPITPEKWSGVLLHWDYRPGTTTWRPVGQ